MKAVASMGLINHPEQSTMLNNHKKIPNPFTSDAETLIFPGSNFKRCVQLKLEGTFFSSLAHFTSNEVKGSLNYKF
jgi:hypothetical protein